MSAMRIGGLASGMDIDSLVEKLMSAERLSLNKLEQQKQTYEWQRDSYRDINTKLRTFDTYIADNLILKSFNTKTATSSNDSFVSATATSEAAGSLTIDGVSQLATAARNIGNTVYKNDNTVVSGTTKIREIKNSPFTGTNDYSILIKSITKDGTLATKATEIKFNPDDTINDLVKTINSSGAGITALFEKGQVSITAQNTGDISGAAEIQLVTSETIDGKTVTANGNNIFSLLELTVNGNGLAEDGQNAKFKVNGLVTERASNTFTLNGYSITLKNRFNENAVDTSTTTSVSSSPVTLSSTNNVDEMMSKIKEFVSTYNGLVTDLVNIVNEEKYRDYKPLTNAQKEEMEDKEIELWEKRAKSGLLRGDSIIRNALSSMRGIVYQTNPAVTNPEYDSLYKIGITTSSNYLSGGTLEIDEKKLREALENDSNSVTQLLTSTGSKTEKIEVNGVTKEIDSRGYLRKLRDTMDEVKIKIEKRAGRATMTETQYTLGSLLKNVNNSIATWQDKLLDIEDRYWRQFTAMETAISKANHQSAMLMGNNF